MIPFFRPHLAGEEGKLVREVLLSGFLNDGPMTARFEDDLANFIGVRHVVCTTSGTAALYLALRAAGVGPGESVVVPDLTFMATASAAKMTGAEVLLAEVGEDLAIDHLTTEHLPARTVVPVHVSGRSARTDYPCTVIEDSCEAFPMKPTGLAACYSFSPLKLITTGQGGAVATDDEDFASRVRALKDHGRLERDSGDFPTVGFNFKFTDLQAAVGLAQLKDISRRMKHQHTLVDSYEKRLSGLLRMPHFGNGSRPLWRDALTPKRDELVGFLELRGIQARPFWSAIHTQTPYAMTEGCFPKATEYSEQGLWLPSDMGMGEADLDEVCRAVEIFFAR